MNQPSGLNIVDDSADFLPPLPLHDELTTIYDQDDEQGDRPGPSRGRTRRRSTSRSPSAPNHEEDEAVTRERKKRKLNEDREARLKLIAKRDEREQEELAEQRSAIEFDEESSPNAQTLALMRHTLNSLRSAANPQVLEMRIMTHHAQDERFGFLRNGARWHEVWEGMKSGKVGPDGKEVIKEEEKQKIGLGGLAGDYGDSESEEDDEDEETGRPSSPPPEPTDPPPPSPPRSPPPLPGSPPPPPLPSGEP